MSNPSKTLSIRIGEWKLIMHPQGGYGVAVFLNGIGWVDADNEFYLEQIPAETVADFSRILAEFGKVWWQ